MAHQPRKYGGADTNRRIIELRSMFYLSRAQLARLTGYSHTYVDNWLCPVKSGNWREAPENAVRLLEFEVGIRRPDRKQIRAWLEQGEKH